eukprot:12482221-Heterocapsa_arctica.AAC.1
MAALVAGVKIYRTPMGDLSVPYGGVRANLICAVMFNATFGNHESGTCTDTGFMQAHEEAGISSSDRLAYIKGFVHSMVTNPDEMMSDNSGTRANKLVRDG